MYKPTVFPNGIKAGGVDIGDTAGTGTPMVGGTGVAVDTDSLQVGTATGATITLIARYSPSLTPTSVTAATTAEQTFTVTGLATTDKVLVNGPAMTAGTGIVNARVSAANTLALTFINATAGALTPAAGTYLVVAFRAV